MKNFDSRVYAVSDLLEWDNSGLLELSPDFQRRAVWTEKGKSYLIDTILRGKPIPKILITQRLQGSRTVRIVVDGQQRLRAILGFINGDFRISRAHNAELAGLTYERLPEQLKEEFLQYELGVDLLVNMSYADILDVFARINSYTVSLNNQEKRNATYLGFFKNYAYAFGYKYVDYFVEANILTKANVARMAEAELSGDLLVALTEGVQTNKGIEQYYKKYEDNEGNLPVSATQFDTVMSYVGAIYPPQELRDTNWSRIQLFYTLFTSLAHNLFGVKGIDPQLRIRIQEKDTGKLRVQLDQISVTYDAVSLDMANPNFPPDYKRFIDSSRRGTTDTGARISRSNFVCGKLKEALTGE